MNNESNRPWKELRKFQLLLCRQLEYAAAEIGDLNDVLRRLAASEQICDTALLGAVVYQRDYNPGQGRTDTGMVYQAGFVFPGGFGAVLWDSEEFVEFRDSIEPPISDAIRRFIPFDNCTPTTQCLLLPQVRPLMHVLCEFVWPDGQLRET